MSDEIDFSSDMMEWFENYAKLVFFIIQHEKSKREKERKANMSSTIFYENNIIFLK